MENDYRSYVKCTNYLGAAAAIGRGGNNFVKVIGWIGDSVLECDVFPSHICHMIYG